MTTDTEEGQRQAQAMQPEPLKVGDVVRLAAGGDWFMTVVELQDYENMAVCEWDRTVLARDIFPVRALVRAKPEVG